MKTLFGTLAVLVGSAILSAVSQGADKLPNIIFIIADDLGWADVEFHKGNVPTPNLKRLLVEGMELRQHYVAPVCSPTRTGFMTGRYWSRFGVTTPTNTLALPMETVTVARALREAGYDTCITGKWHLGSKPEKVDATQLKWDGMNIWPILSGQGSLAVRTLYSAGTSFRSRALRQGDWKLVVFAENNGNAERVELFNVSKDPNEENNLADSKPDKVIELKKELEAAAKWDRDSVALGDQGV